MWRGCGRVDATSTSTRWRSGASWASVSIPSSCGEYCVSWMTGSLRFAFQSQTKLYLISDFFNGGELFYYLSNGRFSENRARFYAAEIAMGLQYLHSKGIVYRDLKPENLLLDADGHIKITDFGLSKENVEGQELHSLCGTPEYLAPEIIMKKVGGVSAREA